MRFLQLAGRFFINCSYCLTLSTPQCATDDFIENVTQLFYRKTLDETMAKLKLTSNALLKEQAKTEDLLKQMLPSKIAAQLRDGRKVQAGV